MWLQVGWCVAVYWHISFLILDFDFDILVYLFFWVWVEGQVGVGGVFLYNSSIEQ